MTYEEAIEVNSSATWDKVCKELDAWIAIETERLKNCNPEQLPSIQQTIRDYERVKLMPQIVKDRLE